MGKRFETLGREHDRDGFDCGVSELNVFLKQHARRQQGRGVSRTFVLVDGEAEVPKQIFGFFTLVAAQLDSDVLSEAIARRLPHRVPCVLLARLAVSAKHHGQGLGKVLLAEAVLRTRAISEWPFCRSQGSGGCRLLPAFWFRSFSLRPAETLPISGEPQQNLSGLS